MTFNDAIHVLQERPDKVAISPLGKAIKLSPSGFIMEAFKEKPLYYRPRLMEIVAATWTCYTPEQLEELARVNEVPD